MKFLDKVELIDTTNAVPPEVLPAHVGASRQFNAKENGDWGLVTELRALMPVREIVPGISATVQGRWRFRWRGYDYYTVTQPMVRRRGGQDHHMAVTLVRFTP